MTEAVPLPLGPGLASLGPASSAASAAVALRPLALRELADLAASRVPAGAVRALLDLAFANGVREVFAEILPENAASVAVVRKLGFRLEGSRVDDEGDAVGVWVACC